MTDHIATVTQHVRATPDVVFAAWTSPDGIRAWYSPVPEWVVGSASVDARVGGGYRVTFGPAPDGDAYVEAGTYTAVEPAARLAFDWTLDGPSTGTDAGDAVITFEGDGDGTIVTVVDRCSTYDQRKSHEEGWSAVLGNLAARLAPQDTAG